MNLHICIYDVICSFYVIIKRHGLFLNNYKMAKQSRDQEYYNELLNGRGMGRAQQLWNAIQDARRREKEGQGSSSSLVPLGRAGIMPRGLVERGTSTCQGRGRGRPLPPPSPPPLEDILTA